MQKRLQETDSLSLTLLMDNVTDRLLPNPYPFVTRATMIANQRVLPSPVAEHGINKIHAIIGGFHLTGGIYEDIIEQTIGELQNADP